MYKLIQEQEAAAMCSGQQKLWLLAPAVPIIEPLLSLCATAVLPLLRSEEHQKAAACGGFPLSLNFHCQ